MWKKIASLILRNRLTILIGLIIWVVAMSSITIINGIKFSTSNAQLLPSSDSVMIQFNTFKSTFGHDDNVITLGYDDPKMVDEANFSKWLELTNYIKQHKGVSGMFSLAEAQKLVRDTANDSFVTQPIKNKVETAADWKDLLNRIKEFPFYNNRIINEKTGAVQSIIYLKHGVVDSKLREQLVFDIDNRVQQFEKVTGINLHLSGMPVIRTMNAKEVKTESFAFIIAALFITSFIFFLFYRSFLATLVSMVVVVCAVILCFAMVNLFNYEITLLTALVPPLLIVIGIPNCIFLINKYQSEYKKHQNKIKALQRMIMYVGNAALLTNFTTAFGFFTFIFTKSETLNEFGVIASLNILGVFILSFLIIPTAYSYFPPPKEKHLKHLRHNWTNRLLDGMENLVLHHRKWVYTSAVFLLILSIVGISMMKKNGNLLDDMSKNTTFYKDISFFDDEFGGIIPLEIMVDTKHPNGITTLPTLKKADQLILHIDSLQQTSDALSMVDLVKLAKQGYYDNDPDFYELPSQQERAFILGTVKNSEGNGNILSNYVDSTQSKMRITTLLKNMDSDHMESTIEDIQQKTSDIFPSKNYDSYVTGAAYVFMKGTHYLTKNLFISLSLAILLIAIFMAIMFRSPQMILISIIPNFLPLLMTAGLMGFLNIPIKPSTILVFSIAFGIAVDDTIHFLAKYRQELIFFKGNISKSVEVAMDEVGNSMFYTSVVLFTGFAVFMFSGFMGIVALGGLVSFTLLCAMFSNLILLPSLLISYENLTTKNFIEPEVDLFKEEEEEEPFDTKA